MMTKWLVSSLTVMALLGSLIHATTAQETFNAVNEDHSNTGLFSFQAQYR